MKKLKEEIKRIKEMSIKQLSDKLRNEWFKNLANILEHK